MTLLIKIRHIIMILNDQMSGSQHGLSHRLDKISPLASLERILINELLEIMTATFDTEFTPMTELYHFWENNILEEVTITSDPETRVRVQDCPAPEVSHRKIIDQEICLYLKPVFQRKKTHIRYRLIL